MTNPFGANAALLPVLNAFRDELGLELGFAHDLEHVEAVGGGGVSLARDGTLMQCAEHCDFYYRFQPQSPK